LQQCNILESKMWSVVFNVGEIAPQGRLHALWGRFCDLRDLGGDFGFQGGDFCKLWHTQMFIDSKNQYLLLWNHSIWCTFDSI